MPLLLVCLTGTAGAEPGNGNAAVLDYTEGGHYDTDFDADFMSEWWYQNGDMRLVGEDGEKKNLAFFIVLVHQESPTIFYDSENGTQLSNLATFYGVYPYEEATSHNYTLTFVPRNEIENYIGFHVPYLDFNYPEGLRKFYGSALEGYRLDYAYDNMQLNLFFKPRIEKTIDSAAEPVNFTTYEYAYGKLEGSVVLDGKRYKITQADGYFDHMTPYTNNQPVWEMEMHGWSWSELTTDSYQTVFYGVRGPEDGYDDYTYKHLTLINKHTGKVIAEYSGDEVSINQGDSEVVTVNGHNVERPASVQISAPDLNISINAQSVVQLDKSSLPGGEPLGFVDFMSFQPDEATIEYQGDFEQGSAFYEYMISDWVIYSP
ncbi:hypothetical protein MSSAC_1189 [Methanosarcina siciliae C2J]|uniref:AttH domain-containing protein n=1 Tax=Methanosarcina siciliae C2J TaxID=1434118 RepID=A0A0E3PLU3_9EURY|nr:hypothetical protein [Methanosarcina siciliae]AKB35779.1 hypothetical protein MSSAC_1189 [Methanosarcina siciliae C2J]